MLAAAAAVVLAELAVRVVAPYLPEPERYGDTTTQAKAAQLQRIADGAAPGPCSRVVVAGNSMARDAFDPAVAAADPAFVGSYNASLDAASPDLLDRWLVEQVVPATDPSLVVVAIASLDLNARSKGAASALEAYETAPATADGPLGRLGAFADRTSALVRHRRELTDPTTWGPTLDRLRAGTPAPRTDAGGVPGLVGPTGEGRSRRQGRYTPGNAVTRTFTTQQLLNDFTLDETSASSLRRLVDDLRAAGTSVVLAALPVTDEYASFHPSGTEDMDRYLATLRDVAVDRAVPLLDLHADAPPEEFADTHHLNGAGADRFSRLLPSRLRDLDPRLLRC